MKKIFESKALPVFIFLLSTSVGIITWKLGTDPVFSITIAIIVELVIVAHSILHRVTKLESLMGYTMDIPVVASMLPKLSGILRDDNRWVKELLNFKFDKFSLEIEYIGNKKLPLTTGEFMEFAQIFFKNLRNTDVIKACSLFGGGDYWGKEYGKEYAKLNIEACKRGVSIVRVFVPRNPENHLQLKKIYTEQSKYLKVKIANIDSIKQIDRYAIRDFLVLNEELAIEFIFSADYNEIESINIIVSKEEVKNYCKKMDKLLSVSSDFLL